MRHECRTVSLRKGMRMCLASLRVIEELDERVKRLAIRKATC